MTCDDYKSCPLYHALMSQLEDEMKRWQRKIKNIDTEFQQLSRQEKLEYYNDKLTEVSERVIRINDFMKGNAK